MWGPEINVGNPLLDSDSDDSDEEVLLGKPLMASEDRLAAMRVFLVAWLHLPCAIQ